MLQRNLGDPEIRKPRGGGKSDGRGPAFPAQFPDPSYAWNKGSRRLGGAEQPQRAVAVHFLRRAPGGRADDRGLPFGEGKQRHPDPSFQPACGPEAVFLSAGGGPCSGGLRRAVLALSAAGRRFGRLLLRGRYRRGFPEKREGRALSFPVPSAGRLSGTGRAGAGFFHCAFGAEYLRCQRPDPGVLHPEPYGPKGHEPHRHGDRGDADGDEGGESGDEERGSSGLCPGDGHRDPDPVRGGPLRSL